MRVHQGIVMLCAAASIGVAVAASAADKSTGDIESAMKSGEILPLEEIIQRATSQFPGRVTEIELGHHQGRYVYEVDVMDDKGAKMELKLDAKTAELLSCEADEDDEAKSAEDEEEEKDG